MRALDAAGNVGTALTALGARTLSGRRGSLTAGPGGTFTWRAPTSGQVTFKAQRAVQVYLGPWRVTGKQIRFADRRGIPFVWFAGAAEGGGDQVKDIRSGAQVDADAAAWKPPAQDLHPRVLRTGDPGAEDAPQE